MHGALYVHSQGINLLIEIFQRSDAAVFYLYIYIYYYSTDGSFFFEDLQNETEYIMENASA